MMQILQVLARGDSRREWGGFSPSSLPQLMQRLMALSHGGHRKLDKQSGKRGLFPLCVWTVTFAVWDIPTVQFILLLLEMSLSILSSFDLIPKEWPMSHNSQLTSFFSLLFHAFLWPSEDSIRAFTVQSMQNFQYCLTFKDFCGKKKCFESVHRTFLWNSDRIFICSYNFVPQTNIET